jgi:hypothetical protein
VRVTLDETGHLAEARVTGVTLSTPQFGLRVEAAAGTPLSDMIARVKPEYQPAAGKSLAAMASAAAVAVRQWQYDPPAAGPISFPVTVTFAPEGPVVVNAQEVRPESPRVGGATATSVPPGAYEVEPEPLRVGGNIKAPNRVRNVNPIYPPISPG